MSRTGRTPFRWTWVLPAVWGRGDPWTCLGHPRWVPSNNHLPACDLVETNDHRSDGARVLFQNPKVRSTSLGQQDSPSVATPRMRCPQVTARRSARRLGGVSGFSRAREKGEGTSRCPYPGRVSAAARANAQALKRKGLDFRRTPRILSALELHDTWPPDASAEDSPHTLQGRGLRDREQCRFLRVHNGAPEERDV